MTATSQRADHLRISRTLDLPSTAVTQTFAIFGKRGSGKSNTAVVLAEEMHRAGAQFAVLDPISAWWSVGVSPTSGSFANNLSALRTLGFLDYPDRKTVRAEPVLFVGEPS